MSKPEFTPGPWGCWASDLRGGRYWTVDRPGEELIDIHEEDNGEADARLIAAAPDMYEALRTTSANIRSLGPAGALDEWLKVVEDALSKAEGKYDLIPRD